MISIIIPCFNTGLFLEEAVKSCLTSSFDDFEVIIINDGSTDPQTLEILYFNWPQNVRIIHQKNSGASNARNEGVKLSRGKYLLFLDSDNRIRPEYLMKSYEVMSSDCKIGVVYSKPFFLDLDLSKEERFDVKSFSVDSLLAGNYIDMCSLVRKNVFLQVGGFDENFDLIFGEDWDLWVRVVNAGFKFHFIDEVLFDYRIRENSIMGQIDEDKRKRTLAYFGSKHGFQIHKHYRQYFRVIEQIQNKPFSCFFRILFYKYVLRKSIID